MSRGLLSIAIESDRYVAEQRAKERERNNSTSTAILILFGVAVVTVLHQSILISDIRHQIKLLPWPAVLLSSGLKIMDDMAIVYAWLILFKK